MPIPINFQDQLKAHLTQNPRSRASFGFSAAITLAYRNLFEQSDTGAILDPKDFVELLLCGLRAVRLEAAAEKLVEIVPNPASIDEKKLLPTFIQVSVSTMIAEEKAIHEFAVLIAKLLNMKGPPSP